MRLTPMQEAYLWLAGAYPDRVVYQGRGKRGPRLLYALNVPGELHIFGYSNPLGTLVKRGLFRRLQDGRACDLTEAGQTEFQRMLVAGLGMQLNKKIREVKVA